MREDRRAAIAVMLAVMLATFIILVACAVDIAFFIFARSQLNSAADAAAIHAVRIAAQQYAAGGTSTDAQTAGIAAGKQWFAAQLGNVRGATLTASSPTVSVNYQTQPGGFVSTVAFSATVPTYVGSFMTPNWTITGSAASQFTNNYLEILMMLDNSSSMQIGASDADMLQMMQLTPCSPLNVTYNNKSATYNSIMSYSAYTCPSNNETTISCPVKKPPNAPYNNLDPAPTGPECKKGFTRQSDGTYPTAGPPCAFACHSDNSKPAGSGADFYALARSTIGTDSPVVLRFDVLKSAVNAMLATMKTSATTAGNLSVGIYTFNTNLTQVYPPSGEAGTDFTAAIAAVGAPPTTAGGADTGIQPDPFITNSAHADTYWAATMDTLKAHVTASGNGGSPTTARKVLFIVTDGYQDDGNGAKGFDTSKCDNFKAMGYTIYVVYTPYRQLFWSYYYSGNQPTVDGTGPGSITYNLQNCASSASNYVSASDQASLTTALNNFLQAASFSAVRVSQ